MTDEEISSFLSKIPDVKSATKETSKSVSDQIRNTIRIQLKELKICPEKIPELVQLTIRAFHSSLITPGEPVGITSAEGIGGPITQMTLNSFHETGAKNAGSGVDIVRELLNLSATRKVESMTIHFKNKNLTSDDVIEKRKQLVGVTIQDLLKTAPSIHNVYLKNRVNLQSYITDVNSVFEADSILDQTDKVMAPYNSRGWWYDAYLKIYDLVLPEVSNYARLTINKFRMFNFELTPEQIVTTLQLDRKLVCVASPSICDECYIDIYPNITENSEQSSLMMLKLAIIPDLNKFLIKGVQGITQIFPKSVKTVSLIRSCDKKFTQDQIDNHKHPTIFTQARERKEMSNTWIVWINSIELKTSGIPLSKLTELFTNCNVKVTDWPKELNIDQSNFNSTFPRKRTIITNDKAYLEVRVETTKLDPTLQNKTPLQIVNHFVNMVESKMTSIRKKDDKEKLKLTELELKINLNGSYTYAESNGANLRDTLSHPLVDSRLTISNNANEIYNIIGIQAAYSFISKDFYDTIVGNSAYCSPRHVTTLVSFMTNSTMLPITSRGVSRLNRGTLADASFENPIDVFTKSAVESSWEGVSSTSAVIFLGNRGKFGTGSFTMGLDNDSMDQLEKITTIDKFEIPQLNGNKFAGIGFGNSKVIVPVIKPEIMPPPRLTKDFQPNQLIDLILS